MSEIMKHAKCGGEVFIYPHEGGRGSGDLTAYAARCNRCGHVTKYLGNDGRKRSAIAEWNRIQKALLSESAQ